MSKNKIVLKRVFACLTAFFLLTGISGCGKGEVGKLPEQTDDLVVYAEPYLAKFLDVAVYRYSLVYPDIKVDVRDFGSMNDPQNERNYAEVLTSELSAGAGPDLILFTSNIFTDVQKTADSGAFQDLRGYITSDSDLNLDDYNTAVLDAGVFDGQRLFVPLSYSMDILLTTQETLTGAMQKLPSTFADWCKQMTSYGQAYSKDTERYFTQYSVFYSLVRSSGLSIVDYASKKVTIDNTNFRSFIDAYKGLYEMDWKRSENGLYTAIDLDALVSLVHSGKILYIHELSQDGFAMDYSALLEDQTPAYIAYPSVIGKPIATTTTYAAVNSNGANKANAYNLLKVMLSEVVQSYGCENDTAFFDIPVLNGVLKNVMNEQNMKYSENISDKTIDDYVGFASNVTCSYVSEPVIGFIWSEMQPYFEGQKSYEECMKSLTNKLSLYINE